MFGPHLLKRRNVWAAGVGNCWDCFLHCVFILRKKVFIHFFEFLSTRLCFLKNFNEYFKNYFLNLLARF